MFRTFWDFGNWLDGPLKWKFGKRWLEVEYTGTAFKHFAWAVSDANNWCFKDALEKLGWAIKDIRIVMWHRRRRLASNDQAHGTAG